MSDRQDASIAVETSEILSQTLIIGGDPLSVALVTSESPSEFSTGTTNAINLCEGAGGYVDDIKFSTTDDDGVVYAALVMCRVPKDDEETGS